MKTKDIKNIEVVDPKIVNTEYGKTNLEEISAIIKEIFKEKSKSREYGYTGANGQKMFWIVMRLEIIKMSYDREPTTLEEKEIRDKADKIKFTAGSIFIS